jgi:hypothetical protein
MITPELLKKALNDIYSGMTEKERLLSAYQLNYICEDDRIQNTYCFDNLFDEDNEISVDSCKKLIDDILNEKSDCINLHVIELLVCLCYLNQDDRDKILYYSGIQEQLEEYEHYKYLYMEKTGQVPTDDETVTHYKELIKEMSEELKEFYKEGKIAKEVVDYYEW